MTSVCLNMIVKNEAHIIERLVASVRPFIDSWAIVDTGSTDGTQALIGKLLRDLPGELWEQPWRDFSHNRNQALALAAGRADYLLFVDADEELVVEGPSLPPLNAACYLVPIESDVYGSTYFRAALVRTGLPWRYTGVVHEKLTCKEPHTTEKLSCVSIRAYYDGARNRNRDLKRKHAEDVALLEGELLERADDPDHLFALAVNYSAAGEYEKALKAHERRATMPGWEEQTWFSKYQMGVLSLKLGRPLAEVEAELLRAYELRPSRAEPLWVLAVLLRRNGNHARAYELARTACRIPPPEDTLYIERAVYQWRALDEFATCAARVGSLEEAVAANRELLEERQLPAAERARVEANLARCARALDARTARGAAD